MALLGAQLVITLVMVSVIQKLGRHYSMGRWLLCSTGLIRYLYPTDGELRQLANIPKDKLKSKRNNKLQTNGKNTADVFHIPRSLDITLDTAKVTNLDVIHLHYFTDYLWLVDFAVYAANVYIITEVYQACFPNRDEVNLSMTWCLLVILFAVKILFNLTIQYFKGEESVGERSTCIVMGFLYLLISMVILIVDERILEIGLEPAYESFNKTASLFLAQQGLSSTGPASKIVLKFFIALWCGILGALFTFPGLRIARMHWDLLKYFRDNKLKQLLLNISFSLPFILVVLWIKPISRDYLTVRIFSGRTEPLMAESTFESMRLIAIVGTMCLKIVLMPWYLQAYLNMAYHRVENQKKEAGRITNIELQKKIAAVFYYLCVVSLQYIAPIAICLFFCLMYKTLGEYTWRAIPKETINLGHTTDELQTNNINISPTEDSFSKSASDFHMTLEGLKMVFNRSIYRGLLGFSTWWCCFLYFATTAVGLVYQSNFSTV